MTYIRIRSLVSSGTRKRNKFVTSFVNHKTANYKNKTSHKHTILNNLKINNLFYTEDLISHIKIVSFLARTLFDILFYIYI